MMMFPGVISQQSISVSDDGNAPRVGDFGTSMNPMLYNSNSFSTHLNPQKKKRNLPGNPHPDSELIALSPRTLMATHRFVCEICNKGFQRDQNLQLHRRGHNLPWKLKQRRNKDMNKKRVYICPVMTCVHHHHSRALGDLTGIKKHFYRKHGEKIWKCDKCEKIYALQSDWKGHTKTCGTKEYRCNCGTLFMRKDSFINHRAFCDALAEESARVSIAAASNSILLSPPNPNTHTDPNTTTNNNFSPSLQCDYPNTWEPLPLMNPHNSPPKDEEPYIPHLSLYQDTRPTSPVTLPPFGMNNPMPPPLSATAFLQKTASIGAAMGQASSSSMTHLDMQAWAHKSIGAVAGSSSIEMQPWAQKSTTDDLLRDFMGLTDNLAALV